MGSDAGELIAARGRSEPLAPRVRVAPPASVPPLVRAAPASWARSGRVAQRQAEQAQAATEGVDSEHHALQLIRENPANRGTETSAEDLVGPPERMVSTNNAKCA